MPTNPPSPSGPSALDRAIAALGSGTGVPRSLQAGNSPMVYLGGVEPNTSGSPFDAVFGTNSANSVSTKPKIVDVDTAISQFYNLSDEERHALGQRFYRAGIISNATDYDQILSGWRKAVVEAGNFYTYAGRKVTPWDMIGVMEGNGSTSGGSGPTTQTQKSTSLNLPSPLEAENVVKTIFQQAFGQDPSKGDLGRYSSLLLAKAKGSPSTTSTTATRDSKGNITSSSTTSGGFDSSAQQRYLMDEAQKNPEYGAYQAATTYFKAAMQAIASPV